MMKLQVLRACDIADSHIAMLDHYLGNGGALVMAGCGRDLQPAYTHTALHAAAANVFLERHGIVLSAASATCDDSTGRIHARSIEVRACMLHHGCLAIVTWQMTQTWFPSVFSEFLSHIAAPHASPHFRSALNKVVHALAAVPLQPLQLLIGPACLACAPKVPRADACIASGDHVRQAMWRVQYPVSGDNAAVRLHMLVEHIIQRLNLADRRLDDAPHFPGVPSKTAETATLRVVLHMSHTVGPCREPFKHVI